LPDIKPQTAQERTAALAEAGFQILLKTDGSHPARLELDCMTPLAFAGLAEAQYFTLGFGSDSTSGPSANRRLRRSFRIAEPAGIEELAGDSPGVGVECV
jgi:hypothetical protein